VRNRYADHGAIDAIVDPVGFAMERKTLIGIQQRAESAGPPAANADRGELVWFTALLGTGLAILAILASRRRPRTRILCAVPLAVAATLVLLRIPSPVLAVALGR
jgi:hypothetical protein